MQFPHWLMIGGGLLVFVGLVGAALQRKRAAADPSTWSKLRITDRQAATQPELLE